MNKSNDPNSIYELKLNQRNYARLFAVIPDAVKQVIKDNKNVVLGGGSIRSAFEGTMPNDFDIFFLGVDSQDKPQQSNFSADVDTFFGEGSEPPAALSILEQKMEDVKNRLIRRGFKVVFQCPEYKLISLRAGPIKVQLINRGPWIDIPDLLKSFDFSVCQFATDNFTTLWSCNTAIKDVKMKRISLVTIKYPAASLNRLHKYRNYGYRVNERFMSDICWAIFEHMLPYESSHDFDALNESMTFYID